jgi:glutamate--cysteine ligase
MVCALLRCGGHGREVQSAAYILIKDWSLEEHSYLRENVPKMGLQTPFRDGTVQEVALKVYR